MSDSDNDSDYVVEEYIQPRTCSVPLISDATADLLGNFDDSKRKKVQSGVFEEEISDNIEEDESQSEEDGDASDNKLDSHDGKISQEQITSLLRGSAKSNRFVLYVTNLNFGTSKEHLFEFFTTVGSVKSVRIPKKRNGGYAFVEMTDVNSFKNAFSLHNTIIDERPIKLQLSEAGKKKSANKKNILKQKNRKLAEMRNETKSFSKSGKNYDKTIKRELANEKIQKTKMWERRKARRERINRRSDI